MLCAHAISIAFLISLLVCVVSAQLQLESLGSPPLVALRNREFKIDSDFSWDTGRLYDNTSTIYYRILRNGDEKEPLLSGSLSPLEPDTNNVLRTRYTFKVEESQTGFHRYAVEMSLDSTFTTASKLDFRAHVIHGGLTLLPPFFTVVAVALSHNILASLYVGVFLASFLIYHFNPVTAFARSFDSILTGVMADEGHVKAILFTWFLSGMVACIIKSGGGDGLVRALSGYARTPRAGMIIIIVLGLLIFFDGIANTLIVGQTVRPISDALHISREKLAFLVDATSSPVTSISPISTWVGFELGLIQNTLDQLVQQGEDMSCYDSSAFVIFIKTIPARYYPFLMLTLQFFMVVTGRELGPMLHAERRARAHGVGANLNPKFNEQQLHDAGAAELEQLEPLPETPRRWWNAVVPVLVTTLMVIITLIVTGVDECKRLGIAITSRNIFSESDSYGALLYGSVLGSLTIWLLCLAQRVTPTGELRWFSRHRLDRPILSFSASLDYWVMGIRNLTGAILVLLMAWAVGSSFTICGTGLFLSSSLSDNVDPGALPFLTFAMSALLACIIGSSWGTMGIMFPLLLPAAHHAAPCNLDVFYGTTASILAGAVFGDHCSPISETTILTSVACRCDLPAHVKTQLPYAIIAGVVGMFIGNLPTGYGVYQPWVGLLLGVLVICILGWFISAPVEGVREDRLSMFINFIARHLPGRAKKTNSLAEEGDTVVNAEAISPLPGTTFDSHQANGNGESKRATNGSRPASALSPLQSSHGSNENLPLISTSFT